jgi:branched-chain amino acid transport system substrate-binding protein
MKAFRYLASAAGVIGLASITAFGGATAAVASPKASAAAATCKASIDVEAPFATGPATQLGLEQLHFAELAVAMANKANKTDITLGQDDTGLNPALATTRTNSIIASKAVGAIGPAGSQEVEAVGPLYAKAGMAFISGSATLPALTTSGANKTSTILIIDDEEAYSEGLVAVMSPILQKAGYTVNHQSYNGNDTGATLQNDFSSLATSQVNSSTHLVIVPWQSAGNAQQFGQTLQQQGKDVTLFGTDGTDSPGQFVIPHTYVSNFGPDISTSKSALDKSIVSGIKKYGPYGAFGVPTWQATTVMMDAIASVCKSGATPSRANVLAAVKKTNIPASQSPEGVTISFTSDGNLKTQAGYLFYINSSGTYVEIGDK